MAGRRADDHGRRVLPPRHRARARVRAPGQRIGYTIQTNGTLLDDDWGELFREHGYLVGISIDGPRELHDAYRVDKGGKGTFDRVIHGLDLLKKHEVEWNVLTTVHAVNEDHGRDVYRYFRDELGATFMQFIPIVERANDTGFQEGDTVTERSISQDGYGRFLVDVFEEWVRRDVGTVYVQMFDVALANWVGEPPGLCVHSETCGSALALEHTGDLYSCDHYVEPKHKLGNILFTHMLDLVDSKQQRDVRTGEARHAAAAMPRMRGAVRVSRRLPEGPDRARRLRRARV